MSRNINKNEYNLMSKMLNKYCILYRKTSILSSNYQKWNLKKLKLRLIKLL